MKIAQQFSNKYGWNKFIKDYLSLVKKNMDPSSVILDAGCGLGGVFAKSKLNNPSKRKLLIGIDVVKGKNPYIDKKYVGSLDKLPFKNDTFDVIVCEWVVEHLKYPRLVFNEFSRVLKKGGHLIIFTPNALNPLVFFSKIIPTKLKDAILNKFLNEEDNDLFHVFLRCNSTRTINKIAEQVGFKREFLKTYPNPHYFRFNNILLALMIYIDKILVKFKFLNFSKMYILACYKK